jgi:ferredoxin
MSSPQYTPNTYYCNQCLDASGNQPDWYVYSKRCTGCGGCTNSVACSADATQRRIQNTVRVSQSEYLENLAGLNVYEAPVAKYGFVNWYQGSDRAEPGRVMRNVPSYNASSTKTSITRMRPGSCSAAGQGVDIKHGSYARYLARLKGRGPYRTQAQSVPAMEGNKTKKYGIAYSHRDDRCMCPH